MKRFFVGVAALVAAAGACDDNPQSHVYLAAPYHAAADCFGPSAPLGQVPTPDGALDCAPTCLVLVAPGEPANAYVSTMCCPYPAGYDTSGTDPVCPAALAAWPAEQTAAAGGWSSCVSPVDAGADGGADAGGDRSDAGGSDAAASDGDAGSDADGATARDADEGGDASAD